MHKRGLCRLAVSVCLTVRPSVMFGYSVRTSNNILNFSPSGSHTILVFFRMAVFRRRPLTGASNAVGVWKNRDFRPISRFRSEIIKGRAIVTMECEKETVPKLSNGIISNYLEWLSKHQWHEASRSLSATAELLWVSDRYGTDSQKQTGSNAEFSFFVGHNIWSICNLWRDSLQICITLLYVVRNVDFQPCMMTLLSKWNTVVICMQLFNRSQLHKYFWNKRFSSWR